MKQASPPQLQLDGAAMLCQIRELGDIGRDDELGGRTRIAFTDAEKAGRDQLLRWMRELELQGNYDNAARVRALILSRCERDTQGGRCPACSGTGELTKPKPHTCPHCHAGYISAPELASDAERSAAQELQYCYSDAVRVFHQYLDKAKAA